ncbi:molybdate transport repressor ModE-like protein [Prauserella shujinwangii]|uniref:Molybdate transport repressor ModE-like protein n=1 Tax=Prauserella shujinwangii TaxID=1453103 RepID=A0A2T0M2Q4_9PSEU|nr:LysR family transcriptional regulator [Prauserella shujinwangii]PRX51033.1 molybdate transport repressor ModE-like protein [Prauserella shujinwangii]
MLDPRRLRLLRDVARTGSIAGAAQRAGCTAAAASQQLAALERHTGVPLLERGARSVRLTEAGRVLAERADRVLAELDGAEQALLSVAGLRGGRLRVAAFGTAAGFTVPALAAFRRRHPDVELTFLELEPDEAVPAVRAGDVDLAVTHQYAQLPKPDLRGLRQTALRSERLLLAVPPSLRPGSGGAVRLRDYADADWISPRPATGFQALVELTCRAAGFEPAVRFRTDSYEVMLRLVAADFGVALVPELAADGGHLHAGVTFRAVARPAPLAREVHATTRAADSSPAVELLLALLVERVSGRGGSARPRRRRG